MRIRTGEKQREIVHGIRGGRGEAEQLRFFQPSDFRGTGRVFGITALKPGSSVGYHKHEGDFEAYYILKGHGLYNDDGVLYEVDPGDFLLCREGECHSLENTGTENLEYIALVLYVKD